ncbi:MAG: hypothetical protein RJA07_166 [Bacteroidota bacterium]|jgi:hypothetical protein
MIGSISCKRYKEDSGITFKSSEKMIEGTWVVFLF